MSKRQRDDPKRPGSANWFDRPTSVGIAAALLTILVAVALAASGASAWSVVSAVAVVLIVAVLYGRRAAVRHQAALERIREDQAVEVDRLRQRWEELQHQTQEATSALERMRDGVIMLSGETKILLINPAAQRLLQADRDIDLHHRPFSEVIRIPELTRAIAAANAGDGVQKLLIEVPHKDTICPIKVRVDRFGESGTDSLLVTLRDETESHRLDEMRREFIANLSHELKTPVAAIKGYAETVELAIKDDPDAAVHFMGQIHPQCLRIERMVSDMMQLARAQAGRGHLNIVAVSMCDAVNESMKSYRPVADAKQITLEFEPPDFSPLVWSDSEAMLAITNNLIGNAIRYTPNGGSVRVSCRDAGTAFALVIEDTGVGIAASDQRRIFERFYRVGENRESGDGGTGIGLSIVKNLTAALRGEVRVKSHPGEGARFEVLLPKAETAASK